MYVVCACVCVYLFINVYTFGSFRILARNGIDSYQHVSVTTIHNIVHLQEHNHNNFVSIKESQTIPVILLDLIISTIGLKCIDLCWK